MEINVNFAIALSHGRAATGNISTVLVDSNKWCAYSLNEAARQAVLLSYWLQSVVLRRPTYPGCIKNLPGSCICAINVGFNWQHFCHAIAHKLAIWRIINGRRHDVELYQAALRSSIQLDGTGARSNSGILVSAIRLQRFAGNRHRADFLNRTGIFLRGIGPFTDTVLVKNSWNIILA